MPCFCCGSNFSCYVRSGYERIVSCMVLESGSKTPVWKMLWTRMKKEKRRFFDSSCDPVHVPYDPYTYSQNFDQGSGEADSENLSRSFSARFAVPLKIFEESQLVD